MSHELHLHKIGPINDCRLTLDTFTVLTGPQANGKSTVAKAVYFFRSVKQDILNIMMQGGPKAVTGGSSSALNTVLKQRMKDKFLQLFGTSWVMPADMKMEYLYNSKISITVSLDDDCNDPSRNYIVIDFSESIESYLEELDSHIALIQHLCDLCGVYPSQIHFVYTANHRRVLLIDNKRTVYEVIAQRSAAGIELSALHPLLVAPAHIPGDGLALTL